MPSAFVCLFITDPPLIVLTSGRCYAAMTSASSSCLSLSIGTADTSQGFAWLALWSADIFQHLWIVTLTTVMVVCKAPPPMVTRTHMPLQEINNCPCQLAIIQGHATQNCVLLTTVTVVLLTKAKKSNKGAGDILCSLPPPPPPPFSFFFFAFFFLWRRCSTPNSVSIIRNSWSLLLNLISILMRMKMWPLHCRNVGKPAPTNCKSSVFSQTFIIHSIPWRLNLC